MTSECLWFKRAHQPPHSGRGPAFRDGTTTSVMKAESTAEPARKYKAALKSPVKSFIQTTGVGLEYDIPVIMVVLDNSMYGTIRMHGERH